jgi:hypothetical protein
MIQSHIKIKMTPEDKHFLLSEVNTKLSEMAKLIGGILIVICIIIIVLIWAISDSNENLGSFIATALAIHFGIFILFMGIGISRTLGEYIEVMRGSKMVLVGKPTKIFEEEMGINEDSTTYYFILLDEIKFNISSSQHHKLKNATQVEIHYTPRLYHIIQLFAV